MLEFNQGFIQSVGTDGAIKIVGGPTIRISDPEGVYGPNSGTAGTAFEFFTSDTENPSISSFSGYPMCVPYAGNADRCPPTNRAGTPPQGVQ
jgi:hypothetical protein